MSGITSWKSHPWYKCILVTVMLFKKDVISFIIDKKKTPNVILYMSIPLKMIMNYKLRVSLVDHNFSNRVSYM